MAETWLDDKIWRADLGRQAIEHYRRVASEKWSSVVPAAIYAWQHEPQTVAALQAAYRKHCLDDDSIGWNELGNLMANALSEAMGATAFVRWLQEITGEDE